MKQYNFFIYQTENFSFAQNQLHLVNNDNKTNSIQIDQNNSETFNQIVKLFNKNIDFSYDYQKFKKLWIIPKFKTNQNKFKIIIKKILNILYQQFACKYFEFKNYYKN